MDHPLDRFPLDIPALLKAHGLFPNKRLGQNFLIDPKYLNLVVAAGELQEGDTILEIGAGVGNLTSLLATKARQVIALEIDPGLIPVLADVTHPYPNVKIIQGDFLDYDLQDLVGTHPYQVVANIPYYITAKLIRKLMTGKVHPQRIVLTIQKEVAERICIQTGKFSLLSLSVNIFGQPGIVSKIPAGAFYPPPKVESAILRVDLHSSPSIPREHLETFFQLAKAGFSQKRKTLANSLSAGLSLDKASTLELLHDVGIDDRRRAETLEIKEWKELTLAYSRMYLSSK